MRFIPSARGRRIAWFALYAAGGLLLSGFLLVWSGVYNIAASRGHWAVVEWLLIYGMRNSVKTHALGIEAPPLNNADLVTLGAGHFHSGCAFCHGAPGVPISPIAQSMLPPPPDLAKRMRPWRDRELFWIVKNGIKYTGMPAWAAQQRDDEVWAMVAFLRRLPTLDVKGYRDLALGELRIAPQTGRQVATGDADAATVAGCARCHGMEQDAPGSALVPLLHGQPVEYLAAALADYAAARRASGIMQPIANDLAPAEAMRVARYYASLPPPRRPSHEPADGLVLERGRRLAEHGDADARIPACAGCHRRDALAAYPRLAGQNAAYMINRLRLWRDGLVPGTATQVIMAPIARLLNDRQIEDVSAYFSSLDAPMPSVPSR